MRNIPWNQLLATLPLSRAEQQLLQEFKLDYSSKKFLPVAQLLLEHKLRAEATEVLIYGVQNHPNYSVARVLLIKELYEQGLLDQAWSYWESSAKSLQDNPLAMRLRFWMQVILSDHAGAMQSARIMILHKMLDTKTQKVLDILEMYGVEEASKILLEEFEEKNITPSLPTEGFMSDQASEEDLPTISENTTDLARKFYVMNLAEVFQPGDHLSVYSTTKSSEHGLDSETLADIYASQGHFQKALNIYRNLLMKSPNNDLFKIKISRMSRALKEQQESDFLQDPEMADRLESLEIIDTQRVFYENFLKLLNENQSQKISNKSIERRKS